MSIMENGKDYINVNEQSCKVVDIIVEKLRYNDEIMKCLRLHLGVDEEDTSKDREIMSLDKREVFRQYCIWNGLSGDWCDSILSAVSNIYGFTL